LQWYHFQAGFNLAANGPFTEYESHSLIASTNIWACLKGVTPTYRKSQPSVSLLKKRRWGQVKVWATVPEKIQEVSAGSKTTLQRQNTEISKQIFPEKEYRGVPISTFMCL
jgi:hypothetical protein